MGCSLCPSIGLLVVHLSLAVCEKAYATDPGYHNQMQPKQSGRVDWTTMASTYTHDVQGSRVDQFAQGVQPVIYERPDYQRSGFRHFRSSLQGGNSADHIHIVDQWGPSVRPYGEWRYPTRPFSVPYPAWGPQLPLTSVNANFNQQGVFPRPGFPRGPHGDMPGGPVGNGVGPQWQGGNQGFGPHPGWQGQPGGPGFGPGFGPGGNGPPNYDPYAGGPNGFGQFGPGAVGQYGVGPANALRADQDEYYAPAPEPPQMPDRDFFFSPGR